MRIGIYIDLQNLFQHCRMKFTRGRVNYREYWKFCQDFGPITIARAYGRCKKGDQTPKFRDALHRIGFETEYELISSDRAKPYCGVKLAVDCLREADQWDCVILGSADPTLIPLVKEVLEREKQVMIFAARINAELYPDNTQTFEIYKALME